MAAAAERPPRIPRPEVDRFLHLVGGWLNGADRTAIAEVAAGWSPAERVQVERLVVAHGLGPALARDPALEAVRAALPEAVAAWLADEDGRNQVRIDRMLGELAGALRALDEQGIEAMPLKGAILATRPGLDPYRRPMADLDLLVRPGAKEAARATLRELGYRRRPDRSRRPTHDTFELPGNEHVVSRIGEHPDNPRRIELHTEVKRHLWGWVDDDDLTPFLWAEASRGAVCGVPATLPSDAALAAHLAIHATSDLLLGRGRLLQWLDLAEVIPTTPPAALAAMPHPRLVAPALRLAQRRLPARFAALDEGALVALEGRLPGSLRRWLAEVPLDTAAGLQSSRLLPEDVSTFEARWLRWAPRRWRLAVAYGDLPLPIAAARHAVRVVSIAARRPA